MIRKESFLCPLPHQKELQFGSALYKIDYSSFKNLESHQEKNIFSLVRSQTLIVPYCGAKSMYPQEYKL